MRKNLLCDMVIMVNGKVDFEIHNEFVSGKKPVTDILKRYVDCYIEFVKDQEGDLTTKGSNKDVSWEVSLCDIGYPFR